MREVIEWDGPGWYASRQVGSYDDTHIETFKVGDDPDERPDTYGYAGTPVLYQYPPEEDEELEVRT